jgi:hypothetical protein
MCTQQTTGIDKIHTCFKQVNLIKKYLRSVSVTKQITQTCEGKWEIASTGHTFSRIGPTTTGRAN